MTNSNRELIQPTDTVNVFFAIRRNKDNSDKTYKRIILRVERNDDTFKQLKGECQSLPGIWRIYKTVNRRSCKKAYNIFMHRLIDFGEAQSYKLDAMWRHCLMKPEARAEKKFLWDIDSKDMLKLNEIEDAIKEHNIEILERYPTPNGWHYISKPFNRTLLNIKDVEINTDGYRFMEQFGEKEDE